jgi:hypothetical protein
MRESKCEMFVNVARRGILLPASENADRFPEYNHRHSKEIIASIRKSAGRSVIID